jgi:hypothetical protein
MTDQEILDLVSKLATLEVAFRETAQQLRDALEAHQPLLENQPSTESTEGLRLLDDFVQNATNYNRYAASKGRRIFFFLASPTALESMRSAAAKGDPAIAEIAIDLVRQWARDSRELTNTDRQFAGAVVRFRMAAEGFAKTSRTGAIHCRPFTRGQVYQSAGGQLPAASV